MHDHKPDAKIIVRETQNQFWNIPESRTYEWEGGRLAAIKKLRSYGFPQSIWDVKVGDVFTLGALRLRCVDSDIWTRSLFVMKDGWKSVLYYWFYRSLIPLTIIYHRLIITAIVWNLADDPGQATIPTWRDLKITKRWRKKQS